MRKSQLIIVLTLLIASIGTAAFAADEAAAPSSVVNINTADATQLAFLPRVGAAAAKRIIEYRTQHGEFTKSTDLMQVKGFGDKTYERLSSLIVVKGDTTLTAKVQGPRKPRAKKQPTNTASK